MPLHIGRVDAEIEITPNRDASPRADAAPARAAAPGVSIESLRPLVLQILREEMASFQRQQG
jgi:hypothetical protein